MQEWQKIWNIKNQTHIQIYLVMNRHLMRNYNIIQIDSYLLELLESNAS